MSEMYIFVYPFPFQKETCVFVSPEFKFLFNQTKASLITKIFTYQ